MSRNPLLGTFVLCALLLQTAGAQDEASSTPTELSAADRLYGLSRFWQEVNYNFAFFDQVPELDWDQAYREYIPKVLAAASTAEYYRLLQRFCALLEDGHTNIYPPDHVKALYDRPRVRLRAVQDRAVVVDVGASLADDLPRGSEILAVDGIATAAYLQDEVFPYLSSSTDYILRDKGVERLLDGPVGSTVEVEIRTPEDRTGTLSLVRDSRANKEEWAHTKARQWQRLEFRWLEGGIAYVSLNSFGEEDIVADFASHLPELENSRGLIIDIRRNGGGNSGNADAIVKHLTDEPFSGGMWKTREHRAVDKAWGAMYAGLSPEELEGEREGMSAGSRKWFDRAVSTYNGTFWHEAPPRLIEPGEGDKIQVPIAVLIDHRTGSAAEDFLIDLDSVQRAVFVGRRTFGSTGQPLLLDLPGGGSARVCTKWNTYPDGREFVGYGISPHVYVELTVEDIISERDAALEKGIEVLRGQMAAAELGEDAMEGDAGTGAEVGPASSTAARSKEERAAVSMLERELETSLGSADLARFMRLVAPDIACLDGSDYATLKAKMGQLLAMAGLQIEMLGASPDDSGTTEIKTRIQFVPPDQAEPFRLVIYFLAGETPAGRRIVNIYDETERREMRDSRLESSIYNPALNRAGLPERILSLIDRRCGVWAGDNVEIVRTRNMEIRFERDPDSPTGLWAQFSLLRYTDFGLGQHVRALTYANSDDRIHKVHALDLGSFAADEPYLVDPDLAFRVVPETWLLAVRDDSPILQSARGESERLLPSGRMELLGPDDELLHRLERVEEVEILVKKPPHPKASEAPIGECLRAWQLGSFLEKTDGIRKRAIITTRRHGYIFDAREDFCYCRSFRYETCDSGMVSKMDVRLMVNPDEFTSRMPADLPQRLRRPLTYDESLFDPTICVITKDANYWSVKSVDDDLILLHGCGGDTYPHHRPLSATHYAEWVR